MSEVIRSLGFYQPFGSLMLHGKIETRLVRLGKKPPFPLGKYLFYSTQKECTPMMLNDWCEEDLIGVIDDTLCVEYTLGLLGFAIGIGNLIEIRPMKVSDEGKGFVRWKGIKKMIDMKGQTHDYIQQCLVFSDVQRIEPFRIKGKQGVGILTEEQKQQIVII